MTKIFKTMTTTFGWTFFFLFYGQNINISIMTKLWTTQRYSINKLNGSFKNFPECFDFWRNFPEFSRFSLFLKFSKFFPDFPGFPWVLWILNNFQDLKFIFMISDFIFLFFFFNNDFDTAGFWFIVGLTPILCLLQTIVFIIA